MALSISQTAALATIIKSGMRVASMGYPDLIAPPEMIEEILGANIHQLKYREDSASIAKWHGVKHRIPDAHSFFFLQGTELDVYDIAEHRGGEIIVDLNYPFNHHRILQHRIGTYDIVLDVGTVEHCFNVARAVMNMASLLKKDGIIIHENPYNCGNHGFYNLNPTWYADFYMTNNGFELMHCRLVTKDGRSAVISPIRRFKFIAEEANVFAMARRVEIKPMVYPMQSKYAGSIPAAGVSGEQMKEKVHG